MFLRRVRRVTRKLMTQDGSIQLGNGNVSPCAFDLGRRSLTLHINASWRLRRILFFNFFFFESVRSISSQRNAGMGEVSMETHFRRHQYLWCCHICFSDGASGKDAEVCSVPGTRILNVGGGGTLVLLCLWVWGRRSCIQMVSEGVCESYRREWIH